MLPAGLAPWLLEEVMQINAAEGIETMAERVGKASYFPAGLSAPLTLACTVQLGPQAQCF